ncbi:hypothetical protein UA08_09198 [Talaromyces atroroseus]|uniref:Peptidase A1 domain-containing protein n=1 Tax=Talaromyces atroroseus TaxID=1441469 RepID=A0A1Q5Q6P8_TALAT|nr:hypothetical protein UA08_09198 [Talaromyces atroroseus]OKL55519.1 hypothetical protein UA08_09198 [Talaromyces atroroseus]
MRVATSLPFIVLSTASVGNALSLHRRDAPRVLEAPLERRHLDKPLVKRDPSSLGVSIGNNVWVDPSLRLLKDLEPDKLQRELSYLMNLTLGTPAQTFTLVLDTGSSDTWVVSANSSVQTDDAYNATASSTYKSLHSSYNATYAGGTTALGTYATDTLGLGSATVKDFQFVVVDESSANVGIAGVGYNISTYTASHEGKVYSNLPYALTSSGITASTAYSLFLNSASASTGTILFGGVNKAKYSGELQTLPIVPEYNEYPSLAIALTEITINNGSSTNPTTTNLPLSVSLDSGTTDTLLPEALAYEIYTALNATYVKEVNYAYVDCDQATNTDANVTYSFSGATITVSMSELVLDGTEKGFPEGTCVFGIAPSKPGVNILGDNFLRSAYVVYDLDNNEISLASAKYDSTKDDILEIGTGADAVPGASVVPSAVSSATGNGVQGTVTSEVASVTAVTITTTEISTTTAATGTTSASVTGATSTTSSSSSGMAALPTGNAKHLLSGLAGAGLLLMI